MNEQSVSKKKPASHMASGQATPTVQGGDTVLDGRGKWVHVWDALPEWMKSHRLPTQSGGEIGVEKGCRLVVNFGRSLGIDQLGPDSVPVVGACFPTLDFAISHAVNIGTALYWDAANLPIRDDLLTHAKASNNCCPDARFVEWMDLSHIHHLTLFVYRVNYLFSRSRKIQS